MAMMGTPFEAPESSRGCTRRSFSPSSLRFFFVATTVPTTRPINMASGLEGDVVDDAHDGGVGGDFDGREGIRRLLRLHPENPLARTRAHGVGGDEGLAGGGTVGL